MITNKVEVDESEQEMSLERGGIYRKSMRVYILAQIHLDQFSLINLANGNRYAGPRDTKRGAFDGHEEKFERVEQETKISPVTDRSQRRLI